jgi:hypothetical protein
MKKSLFVFALFLLFTACETKFKESKVSTFSLNLPDFLTSTTSLNDKAVLQYSNAAKEFYIVVLEYPKKDLGDMKLDQAYKVLSEEITGSIKNGSASKPSDVKTNGLNVKRGTMSGSIDNAGTAYPIFYKLDVIEGKEKIYEVIVWTLEKFKGDHEKNMDKILNSFKEI